MIYLPTGQPRPVIFSADATLKSRHFTVEQLLVIDTAAVTLTLPTPTRELAGKASYVLNSSDGEVTLSGAFPQSTSSCVLDSKTACILVALPTASSTYKWNAIGVSSALTGMAEMIADTVGSMVSSNTESLISVVYQDADNTLDFTVDCTATPTASKIPIADGSGHLDGWISAATAATPGLVEHLNWGDYVPTWTFATADPTTNVVIVGRYMHIGNCVIFYCSYSADDGGGGTLSHVSLPVAPSDKDTFVPLNGYQKVNTTYTHLMPFVDATTDLRIEVLNAQTNTDDQAVAFYISGMYEVAAT